MGCDLHMYVQYREKERANTKYDWWDSFGNYFGNRDYTLFGILARVRERGFKHSYEPKGIPEFKLSYICESDLYLQIREEGEEKYEGSCTLEEAKRWGHPIINDKDGKPYKTLDPDWHSYSWLTIDELKQAFKWYKKETGQKVNIEYRAMLKAMEELEDEGKNEVVVVFWFDN
jgi:hypothetical protein